VNADKENCSRVRPPPKCSLQKGGKRRKWTSKLSGRKGLRPVPNLKKRGENLRPSEAAKNFGSCSKKKKKRGGEARDGFYVMLAGEKMGDCSRYRWQRPGR